MKAKTRFQKEVQALHDMLPEISESVKKKIIERGLPKVVWKHNTKEGATHWCNICGATWTDKEDACKHAKGSQIEINNKRKLGESNDVAVMQAFKGWQVVRIIRVVRIGAYKGDINYSFYEVQQFWMDETGRDMTFQLRRQMSYYYDLFNLGSDLEIRSNYVILSPYATIIESLIPEFKKRGLTRSTKMPNYNIPHFLYCLLTESHIETLVKAGRMDIVCNISLSVIDAYWQSVKIAVRHHYKAPDWGMWRDMLGLMRSTGKDLASPKYVCPSDLKATHDWVLKIDNKMRHERRLKEERDKIKNIEEREADACRIFNGKRKYFDVELSVGDIYINVLSSIEQYFEEGEAMHHCVYANKYYAKKESLILSAKEGKKRVATIELDLRTFKVLQCRGACNSVPEHKDDIVNCIESNAKLFKRCKRKAA